MKHKVNFSKRDIVVVLSGVGLVLLNIGAIGSRGRERAKRAVCLANLNKLAHAWILYADDNNGRIVNGAIGFSNMQMSWGDHKNELAWVDESSRDWNIAIQGIEDGALWPYLRDTKIYRCPARRSGEALTYAIMSSMNAVCLPEVQGVHGAYIKKMSDIHSPGASLRLVFIDEGYMTPDAYMVYYAQERWWDGPPVCHSNGTTVSFADGHAGHWKWEGIETIERANDEKNTGPQAPWAPQTSAGFQDLYRMQKGCWGKLGYAPSH